MVSIIWRLLPRGNVLHMTRTTALVITADETAEHIGYSNENSWFNFSVLQGLCEGVYGSSKNNSIRIHS